MEQSKDNLKKRAFNLPNTPGVYIMKNSEGKIIYIGKAKALKNRVTYYFSAPNTLNSKTRAMVSNIASFEIMKTKTELEALLLECSLIKEHKPKYNILLKDDKGLNFITFTKDIFPLPKTVSLKGSDRNHFGPYLSRGHANEMLSTLRKVFLLPGCSRVLKKRRPCLNYSIGLCTGPCAGKISAEGYGEIISAAKSFLNGNNRDIIEKLTLRMEAASEKMDYEKAAALRDSIKNIQRYTEKQTIFFRSAKNADAVSVLSSRKNTAVCVLPVRNGIMLNSYFSVFNEVYDHPDAFLSDFLAQYYDQNEIPASIYVNALPADSSLIKEFLREKKGKCVNLVAPKKNTDGSTMLEYAYENVREHLIGYEQKWGLNDRAGNDLMRLAHLSQPPKRIEMYDISHTAGSDTVAGMTVFEDFRPQRSDYRRFIIRYQEAGDDVGALTEAFGRRISNYLEGDSGFDNLPDLVIADGALPQLNALKSILLHCGIDLPVVALKKDSRHKTKSLVLDTGTEIPLKNYRELWTVMSKLQEEVHRYSVEFHSKRRSASVKTLSLTKIPGVGPKKARLLLGHFRSLQALRGAAYEEIRSVKGIDEKTAAAVYKAMHEDEM